MFAPARRRCTQCAANISLRPSASIPTFLLPAFAPSPLAKTFTTTSPCQSKIGSAPLSVPQGVTFNIIAPSAKGRGTRTQAMSTVQIKGPLGELSMQIPSYINIDQDPRLSGPMLTIQDSTDAKQKCMWGTIYVPRPSGLINNEQERRAHISRTISSASAKATAPSSASSVSAFAPQLKTVQRPSNQSTPAKSS